MYKVTIKPETSFITELNDHASINITPVIINPFIPLTHTSTASENVNIFLNTPIPMATIDATNPANAGKTLQKIAEDNLSNGQWCKIVIFLFS